MRTAFPESIVTGYEGLIPAMKNNPKDAHVLAAAVQCGAHAIVSDNKRHFPKAALAEYSLECLTAGEFLERQFHFDRNRFNSVITSQAADIGKPLNWLLARLPRNVAALIRP
jgi:hypothetical protein